MWHPRARSALEVQRNYEAALKKAGATLLYDCNERDRGCLRRGGADTYVTVYTVDVRPDAKPFGGLAASYLQIVQAKPMDTGKVAVFDAAAIATGLSSEGKVSLYGI